MISKNIATWRNYSKAKGGRQLKSYKSAQHYLHGDAGKTESAGKINPLRKHINFNVDQLREDARKLLITDDNKERIAIGKLAKNMAISHNITRADNNDLWEKVEKILYTHQITSFPLGTRTNRGKRGNTTGNETGNGTNCNKDKITRKTKVGNPETK